MDLGIGYERLTAAAGCVRAEAVFPRLEGQGSGIARINAFYRRAAETFLARAAGEGPDALPGWLPEGRYTARLSAAAELEGSTLTVTLDWRLCRRGRMLEEGRAYQRWQLPRGYLQPPDAVMSKKGR